VTAAAVDSIDTLQADHLDDGKAKRPPSYLNILRRPSLLTIASRKSLSTRYNLSQSARSHVQALPQAPIQAQLVS
jgi:hypothetical protein